MNGYQTPRPPTHPTAEEDVHKAGRLLSILAILLSERLGYSDREIVAWVRSQDHAELDSLADRLMSSVTP